jgi:hypothetical protein
MILSFFNYRDQAEVEIVENKMDEEMIEINRL